VVEIAFEPDVVLLIGDRFVRFTGDDAAKSIGMGFRVDRRLGVARGFTVGELPDAVGGLSCLRFRFVLRGDEEAGASDLIYSSGGGDSSESDSYCRSSRASSVTGLEGV